MNEKVSDFKKSLNCYVNEKLRLKKNFVFYFYKNFLQKVVYFVDEPRLGKLESNDIK